MEGLNQRQAVPASRLFHAAIPVIDIGQSFTGGSTRAPYAKTLKDRFEGRQNSRKVVLSPRPLFKSEAGFAVLQDPRCAPCSGMSSPIRSNFDFPGENAGAANIRTVRRVRARGTVNFDNFRTFGSFA